jgi:hypothetical protein
MFWNMAQGRPIEEINKPIDHVTPKWQRRWESFKPALQNSRTERRLFGAPIKGLVFQEQQVQLPQLTSAFRVRGFEYLWSILDQIADVWPMSERVARCIELLRLRREEQGEKKKKVLEESMLETIDSLTTRDFNEAYKAVYQRGVGAPRRTSQTER